jgi:hypothetical protein
MVRSIGYTYTCSTLGIYLLYPIPTKKQTITLDEITAQRADCIFASVPSIRKLKWNHQVVGGNDKPPL